MTTSHELHDIVPVGLGEDGPQYVAQCKCNRWDSRACDTEAEARAEHDEHRRQQTE